VIVRHPLVETRAKLSAALVTSGTATLETALAGVPMIVIYKVNRLSYEIGRRLISVPFISLVNLIAGREIVPELIQQETRPEIISAAMRRSFDNPEARAQTIRELKRIKTRLGQPGGAGRAAAAILEVVQGR
jgi:lipid-A-disaccharide synthase